MRDHLQEYFTLISNFRRAQGVRRELLKLPTKLGLEELSRIVPSSSRLCLEVNRFLAQNFSQPLVSTL